MYGQYIEAGGKQFVHCREVVLHSSECPLSEVHLSPFPYPPFSHAHILQNGVSTEVLCNIVCHSLTATFFQNHKDNIYQQQKLEHSSAQNTDTDIAESQV